MTVARLARLLALPALACAALIVGVSSGWGAAPDTPYDVFRVDHPEPEAKSTWGTRAIAANDLTGDGVADLFVDSYQRTVAGQPRAGKAYLVSGADRSVRYELNSPEVQAQARFGIYISVLGDVNGDGKDDVAVGTDAQDVYTGTGPGCGAPEPNGCNEDQGKIWVFSGPTGRLLYAVDNPSPQPQARFGSRIGRAGDVTGDGRPDLVVGAVGQDMPAGCGEQSPVPAGCRKNEGEAFIFNGASGTLVRRLSVPPEDRVATTCTFNCGGLGHAVQGVGDTDGDGVTDQLVDASSGAGGVGRMYLFDGRTGAARLKIDDPNPQPGAFWGFDVPAPLSPGDVNGDGFADLYGHGFSQDGPAGTDQGNAWVFNGKTGAPLYELKDPTPNAGDTFGFAMAKTDYNQDGTPDVYVGSSPHHAGGSADPDQNGESHIFDGRDGSLLRSLQLPAADRQATLPGNSGPNFGIGVAAPGDLNGDGQPDYVSGAFLLDVAGNQDQGGLYVFLSKVSASSGVPVVGGPPSGGPGGGPARDADPPLIALSGKLAQKIGRGYVYVNVLADEDSTLAATGSVSRPLLRSTSRFEGSKAKTYGLLATRAVAKARRKVTLRLRLTKKAVKAVRQGLDRGRRSTARVRIVATDVAGNKRVLKRQIRIKE